MLRAWRGAQNLEKISRAPLRCRLGVGLETPYPIHHTTLMCFFQDYNLLLSPRVSPPSHARDLGATQGYRLISRSRSSVHSSAGPGRAERLPVWSSALRSPSRRSGSAPRWRAPAGQHASTRLGRPVPRTLATMWTLWKAVPGSAVHETTLDAGRPRDGARP
jgi:hypothetical protein